MAFLTFHILYSMLFRLSALVCKILYNKGLYLYVAMPKYVCLWNHKLWRIQQYSPHAKHDIDEEANH